MKLSIRIQTQPHGLYVARCPSLPGCVACASTRETVQRKMHEAVVGYLASMNVALPAQVVVTESPETCED